jgi:putative mRNA 3-end processing factor
VARRAEVPSVTESAIRVEERGLRCDAGELWIDPWLPVPRAVLTHAHADHARPGSETYICATPALDVLQRRLGPDARIEAHPYGEPFRLGGVTVSLHPSGHVLGAAQVRIAAESGVTVVSGDFKRAPDPTTLPFEVVPCDTFISEATFALPIFRWEPGELVAREILAWWDAGVAARRASVLFCYALGKAQRILAELGRITDRPIYVHGAIEPLVQAYRDAGVALPPTLPVAETARGKSFAGELVLAPTSAANSLWMRRFGDSATAVASGWMRIRGARRRKAVDRGFVLSDHADWPALLATARETGARTVLATHGHSEVLARALGELGLRTGVLPTPFEGEADLL